MLHVFLMSSAFFGDSLRVSRLTTTVPQTDLNKPSNSWLFVHGDTGPYPVRYVVAGNVFNFTSSSSPSSATMIIDILVAKQVPSGLGDVYLPINGHSDNRALIVDPAKAWSIQRYIKDIPHRGVWSLDVPPINSLNGTMLIENEVVVCFVHSWTWGSAIGFGVDCALFYKVIPMLLATTVVVSSRQRQCHDP
ncbi:hypothetical protein BJV74DRAFT_107961 [Russula compacta]|nr:hypothetical protein BJV74DRAFT_107961 [Russula compacta]